MRDEVAAVEQAVDLLAVDALHLVERHGAEARIVDVGRNRQGLVGRPQRADHEARLAGICGTRSTSAQARVNPRRRLVDPRARPGRSPTG